MKSSTKQPFATRDAVNFWAHIGEAYPTPSIRDSNSRCLMSLFSHRRSYIALKVADTRQLEHITQVRVSLYRKDSILALRLSFSNDSDNPFFSVLPFNASLDSIVTPNFPKEGEPMEIEVHFINYLNNDILSKVIRITVDDPSFTKALVTEYSAQLRAEMPHDIINLDAKAIMSTPYQHLDKYLLLSSDATIIKQYREENEPLLNENVASPYNALAAV